MGTPHRTASVESEVIKIPGWNRLQTWLTIIVSLIFILAFFKTLVLALPKIRTDIETNCTADSNRDRRIAEIDQRHTEKMEELKQLGTKVARLNEKAIAVLMDRKISDSRRVQRIEKGMDGIRDKLDTVIERLPQEK